MPTSHCQEKLKKGFLALHVPWELHHDGGYQIEEELDDPIAFVASSNPNIMYLDQEAMKQPDAEQF